MNAFREFKTLWDPKWKMNPGKMIDPFPRDGYLRLGANYNPWQPRTKFRFPEDEGSFARAMLRCVGVGKCGLAGPFGFEQGHYEVSMKIGEEKLFPAVRNADKKTPIVAEGYSCRKQIEDGTGRKAMHLSQVMWNRLKSM